MDTQAVVDGSGDACEDVVATGDRFAVVADGTSGFGGRSFTDGESDGRWYTARLVDALAERLADGRGLREACADAIRETALAFAAQVPAGLDRSVRTAPEGHDLPNAKVTAARWGSDGLSYLVLGDVSAAFVAPDDHVTSAGVLDRIDARTARVRSEMLARGADEATAREHQLAHVRRTRTHCNVPGGYWVARLNPLAAEFAATGTRAPDDGPALLYTDGFDPLVTTYDEFDGPPAMAAFAAEAGVDALRDRLRDAEAADPGSVRVHGADDAAAVLVRP